MSLLTRTYTYSSPPYQTTFQLSNFLATRWNQSIWLSGYLAIWLSGWTTLSGYLAGPTCCTISFSICCNTILHLLLILFPLVAPALSTCCSSFFHLLIPLNPLVASLPPLYPLYISSPPFILSLQQPLYSATFNTSHSILLKLY